MRGGREETSVLVQENGRWEEEAEDEEGGPSR